MYEMLFADTPFYAESLVETYAQIMDHTDKFAFPSPDEGITASENAKDLLCKLICDRSIRLGKNGLSDFRSHPFFEGIQWETIRDQVPPYVPEIQSPTDTSNFPDQLEEYRIIKDPPPTGNNVFTGKHLPFVGFTYTKSSRLSGNVLPERLSSENSPPEHPISPIPAPRKKEEPKDDEIRRELQSLKEMYNYQTKELASAMEKIDELTMTNDNLERNAHESNEATEKLQVLFEKLERENVALKSNIEKVAAEQKVSDVFSSRLDNLHDELEESQALLLEKDALIEQLSSELDATREQLSSRRDGEKIQRQRIASLEGEVNGLESQISSLRFVNNFTLRFLLNCYIYKDLMMKIEKAGKATCEA